MSWRERASCRQITAAFLTFLLGQGAADAQLTPLSTPLPQAGYSQVSTENGVTVFRHGNSPGLRYAAEGFFTAPPATLMAVVLDYERHTNIMPHVAASHILKRGKDWLLVYQRLALPAVTDRDYVMRVTWGSAAAGTTWLRYVATNQAGLPNQSGVVRVRLHEGGWQFRPAVNGNGTFGRYELMIDLGGWVPRWMVRSRMAKEMATAFRNLQQLTAVKSTSR